VLSGCRETAAPPGRCFPGRRPGRRPESCRHGVWRVAPRGQGQTLVLLPKGLEGLVENRTKRAKKTGGSDPLSGGCFDGGDSANNSGANVTVSRTHTGFSLCFQIIRTFNRFEVKQGGALFSDTCGKQRHSCPPKFKISQKAALGRRPSGHAASGGVGAPIELAD
jgi:hypothetical protein